MAITVIFDETSDSIGVGKNKATFLEVLIGEKDIALGDIDPNSGNAIVKAWSTGSSLSEAFGLVLVSQSFTLDRRGVGGSGDVSLNGYMLVSDDGGDAETGEGILREDNWKVDNILATNGYDAQIDGSANGAPVYRYEEYSDRAMQRVFVAPTLHLEMTYFIGSMAAEDSLDVTAKFVFKKVKMTKSAYMEKLAIRAYS